MYIDLWDGKLSRQGLHMVLLICYQVCELFVWEFILLSGTVLFSSRHK